MSVKPPTNNQETVEFESASLEVDTMSVKPPTMMRAAAVSVESSFEADEAGSVKPPTAG